MSHNNDLVNAMKDMKVESYPPCTACGRDVVSDAVEALQLPYHRRCLTCVRCKTHLEQGQINDWKQRPHCTDCYAFFQGKVCARCGEGASHAIKALDKTWHKQCFTCAFCHEALAGSFVEEHGKPYHEHCLRKHETATAEEKERSNAWQLLQNEGNSCHQCKKQVAVGEGLSIKAPFKTNNYTAGRFFFHDGCFRCDSCRATMGTQYVLSEQGFFCEACAQKQNKSPSTASPCAKCGKGLEGRITRALGKEYHAACFVCTKCARPFPNGEFVDVNGKPTCENCA